MYCGSTKLIVIKTQHHQGITKVKKTVIEASSHSGVVFLQMELGAQKTLDEIS